MDMSLVPLSRLQLLGAAGTARSAMERLGSLESFPDPVTCWIKALCIAGGCWPCSEMTGKTALHGRSRISAERPVGSRQWRYLSDSMGEPLALHGAELMMCADTEWAELKLEDEELGCRLSERAAMFPVSAEAWDDSEDDETRFDPGRLSELCRLKIFMLFGENTLGWPKLAANAGLILPMDIKS